MGRFAELYTADQRQACAEAVVDGEQLYGRRIYPKEAVRMAAAGELRLAGKELPPFAIKLTRVQKLATDLRRRREGQLQNLKRERGTIEERLDAAARQRLRILEHVQDRLEREEAKRGLTGQDLADLKTCGQVEREIRARQAPPSSHTGRGARKPETEGKDETPQAGESELVKRMRQDIRNWGDSAGPASSPAVAAGAGAGAG